MRKFLFILLPLLYFTTITAQRKMPEPTKYGFSIGANYSGLVVKKGEPKNIGEISHYGGAGFRVGLVADHYINEKFSFVPKIEMSFNQAGINVAYNTGISENRLVYPITAELAPHFNYKLNDKLVRPYFLFGGSFKIPVTSDFDQDRSSVKATAYCIDIGFGMEKKLPYFNFSPEIRYSYGINNISNVTGIKNIHFHCVSLVLTIKA